MKLISEAYRDKLKRLAGITEAFGTGNVSEKEREEAFAKTNERVPYKKDLMIYAIKGGFEIGLLFKTKNDKDKMPIAKYRTVLPVAIGIHKSSGNEVVSAFHEIGQSESKARLTGRRSAEAKNEWRLFNTNNILSMWITGKTFDKAPEGFKGSNDARMSTVEVYFKPEVAKEIQSQQQAEKDNKVGERNKLVNRGFAEPKEEPVEKPESTINKKPKVKNIPIKSVSQKTEKEPLEKIKKPVINSTSKEKSKVKSEPIADKSTINNKPRVKPVEKKKESSTINNKERPGSVAQLLVNFQN